MRSTTTTRETVRGEVESVRHVGADFWGFASVATANDGAVTVTGKLVGVKPGDAVECSGAWVDHPKFGRQFRAREVVVTLPSEASGIVAWLMSRIPGLGRARATAAVERFGAGGIWDVIENSPERFAEIKGITPAKCAEIRQAYDEHRGERDRSVRFKGWGLTDAQIAAVTAAWGANAEAELRADPYRLAWEVRGFGFERADAIASRMGIPKDAPGRLRAGILHTLETARGVGHCYVPASKLAQSAARLLDVPVPVVMRAIEALPPERARVVGERCWLAPLLEAEEVIAERAAEAMGSVGRAA